VVPAPSRRTNSGDWRSSEVPTRDGGRSRGAASSRASPSGSSPPTTSNGSTGSPKGLTKVADFAAGVSGEEDLEELIVVGGGEDRPHIVDGNHRAIGMALHILEGDEYIEQGAYVGVGSNRIASDGGFSRSG
jgi:hypothetical protein